MIGAEINGLYLDLYEGSKVAINKAIGKIGDVSNRNGDYSIAFKAPLNSRNLVVLGTVTALNTFDDPFAFKRFSGRLTKGTLTISGGYFQILNYSVQKAEIELRFLGGNSDWFERISANNINELSYTEIIHSWNVPALVATWQPTRLDYVYIPYDNQKNSGETTNDVIKDSFSICVFSIYIFRKIFEVAGLKVGGSILNDARVRNEMVVAGIPLVVQDLVEFIEEFTPDKQKINATGAGESANFIYFPNGDASDVWNGTGFTALQDYPLVEFFVEYTIEQGLGTPAGTIDIIADNSGGANQTEQMALTQRGSSGITGYYTGVASFTFNNVLNGDVINFSHLINMSASNGTAYLRTAYGAYDSRMTILYEGDTRVDPGLFLPSINQGDFIKDIMFRNGYISTYNATTSTVFFNKFDELESNKRKAQDWTEYIDHSTEPIIDFTEVLEGYTKRNIISYAQDSDDIQLQVWRITQKEGLGATAFESESDYTTGKSELYKSPFAPTAQIWTWPYDAANPTLADWLLPFIPLFTTAGETQEIESRIMLFAGVINVSSINRGGYTDLKIRENGGGQTTTVSELGYGFFVKPITEPETGTYELDTNPQTLAFENPSSKYVGLTLIQESFKMYQKVLTTPIMLKAQMLLPEKVVADLNQLIPVYISYRGAFGYYYVDEVVQYDGESSNEVKLVKI